MESMFRSVNTLNKKIVPRYEHEVWWRHKLALMPINYQFRKWNSDLTRNSDVYATHMLCV